jgi:SulP family sulfate permease
MTSAQPGSGLRRYLPILEWLPAYDRSWLAIDIIGGLTLWGLVVPEGMAYAGIAGLPPQTGLYALLASLLVYALLGTSRHLVVSATSATAALLASSVAAVLVTTEVLSEGGGPADANTLLVYASAFILVVGAVFLVAGVARLGFITQFLSKPVMDGFVTGLAVFVTVGQLNKLFGVPKGDGNTVQKLVAIVRELPQANWVAFAFGAAALALLFLLPRWSKRLPAGLVVLAGSVALSAVLGLDTRFGVEVVGRIPQGLPSISVPRVPLEAILAMVLPAIGVLLVAYSEALAVASEFADKHGYEIDPDQELNAHAFSNLLSGLFGGMITAGGMSASAVKEGSGARSQVTNLVTWVLVVITLLFLTPIFAPLPEAVLAALIIHALWHILAARKIQRIQQISQTEFWLAVLAFLGVILIDVLEGMIIGIVAALVLVVARSSRPHLASLGRAPGVAGVYTDLDRHPENLPIPGLLILRLDSPLYYYNALRVRDDVRRRIASSDPPPRAILLDVAVQDDLDVTSGEMLLRLVGELHGAGIDLFVADAHATVRAAAARYGLVEPIGADHFLPTLEAAVRDFEGHTD